MKKQIYKNSVLLSVVICAALLTGAAFGGSNFAVSNSSNVKKQLSSISSKTKKVADYQNQTFRILNNASTTMADTVLHWDGPNASGVGDDITQWRGVVVFTPTELDPFVGTHQISEVWAWMRTPVAWDSVLVEVYEGVTINSGPPATINLGTMVYSQDITSEITTLDDWTVHTLTNPVPLQSGQIYAAVIFVEQNMASQYPLGVDAGPMVSERGGWVLDPTLPNGAQLADFGINFNWNIRMGLSAAGGGQTVLLDEGFEGTFPPVNWLKLNPDGGTGWDKVAIGTTPVPGWTGGVVTGPPNGGSNVAFCTWTTGGSSANDQWIVSPQITNVQAMDTVHFWMRYWPDNYADNVDVLISTTGNNDPANFTTTVDLLSFAAGSDTSWVKYSYRVDNFVSTGSDIYIALREHVADNLNDGASISVDNFSYTRQGVVGIGDNISFQPDGFALHQNYPNPFNPATTIAYQLAGNANVVLKIYNVAGQEIKTLVNEKQSAGPQKVVWDGSDNSGQQVASGIYLYKLHAGDQTQTKKMILLK